MTLVVGHGLLGSAVAEALCARRPSQPIEWSKPDVAHAQLRAEAAEVPTEASPWAVAWCAGASTMRSSPAHMADESSHLEAFLNELTRRITSEPMAERGLVFLASSAGGIYGRGAPGTITETHPVAPLTAYAHGKLAQEALLRRFHEQTGVRCLVGRISNLYGASQNLAKSQGLVSHVCRTTLRRSPLTVTVPLDTRRDYVHAADAARRIAAWMSSAADRPATLTTKLVVSGRSATVAEIIAAVRRVSRLRPLVVYAQGHLDDSPRYQSFRSIELPELDAQTPCRSLDVGVSEMWAATWAAFVRPRLRAS